jgi:hypothetical protein
LNETSASHETAQVKVIWIISSKIFS